VIAQLINAGDGTHLWSKSFDRDLQDIFAVQDEIAQEVVRALKVSLLSAEEIRMSQRYQPTLDAYEQLILGRQEMAKRTVQSLTAAEKHFKLAIESDPDYALAYVALADTYSLQNDYAGLALEESLQRRLPLIDKALVLDPLSGEAYTARAYLNAELQEFKAAEEDYIKAIELNSNYAQAHHWYSFMLIHQGRFEEALTEIRMAAELDPMSPIIQQGVAEATWYAGYVEEALMLLRRSVERNPEFPVNYVYMGNYQNALGHLGEAQRWYQQARKWDQEGAWIWRTQCIGLLHLGDASSAEDCVNQLNEFHADKLDPLSARRWLQVFRGEWNAAISTGESILERMPGGRNSTIYLADLIARQGDVERARSLMADKFPELLEGELQLATTDLNAAVVFAAILNANDETQKRNVLLVAMEERIASMHRIHGIGYGILDVYIHVMRGNHDRAVAALRAAIDAGWRAKFTDFHLGIWWTIRQDWKLVNLHQNPEFMALVHELETDVKAQRLIYEANKDKPLF
jgi:tetratricopeptide (TPR) repeat protein